MPVSWSILIGKRIATEKRREGAATIWQTSDQSAQRVVAGRPAARPWCGYAAAMVALRLDNEFRPWIEPGLIQARPISAKRPQPTQRRSQSPASVYVAVMRRVNYKE